MRCLNILCKPAQPLKCKPIFRIFFSGFKTALIVMKSIPLILWFSDIYLHMWQRWDRAKIWNFSICIRKIFPFENQTKKYRSQPKIGVERRLLIFLNIKYVQDIEYVANMWWLAAGQFLLRNAKKEFHQHVFFTPLDFQTALGDGAKYFHKIEWKTRRAAV